MVAQARIEVTEDGPYVVRGDIPLVRVAEVVDEYGDPVDRTADEPLRESADGVELCRCGGSSTKPFCDRTHLRMGFHGAETAVRGPRMSRAQVFPGDGIVMTDDRTICSHASFCAGRKRNAWRMIEETDDPEVRAELQRMISLCPSGALAYAVDDDADDVEPSFERSVAVVKDGPLFLRGSVTVVGADGIAYETRNRMTLCRCGRSRNKPFCDGTHADMGFTDD
jgi:CDGSH-type Zn-finger protein